MHLRLIPRIPSKRTICAAAALLCFAAAIVLTPSSVRSQYAAPDISAKPALERAVPTLTPIAPERDAFAPRAVVDDAPPAPIARTAMIPPAPPLRPGMLVTRAARPSARVSAIAMGSTPTAIVETADGTRAVTAGDALAGSRITAIVPAAIELANGRRLPLTVEAPAP